MEINHKFGESLYQLDDFGFRYEAKNGEYHTAHIQLTHFLGDDSYCYEIDFNENHSIKINGSTVTNVISNDYNFYSSYGLLGNDLEFKALFSSKDEALQHAVNTIYVLLDKNKVD